MSDSIIKHSNKETEAVSKVDERPSSSSRGAIMFGMVTVITAPEKRTKKTIDKLKTVAGRVLNK